MDVKSVRGLLATSPVNSPLMFGIGLSIVCVLCGCTAAPMHPPVTVDQKPGEDCHRFESERFVLHSDPWINLHHFLFEWARNVPEREPEDRRRALDVKERSQIALLDERDRQTWEQALAFYRKRWVAKRLAFDQSLIKLRDALATISCTDADQDGISAETRAALTAAMPVYRRHWWARHHAHNQSWIEGVLTELNGHESVLAKRIAEVYGGQWPSERVRVDASAYVSWSGAYTTNYPDHVTITSTNSAHIAGLNALEMLFHEISHATFFEEPFAAELRAAFQAHATEVPDRLSHVVQWVTPAVLMQSQLSEEELRSFQPYGERSGLYERSRTRNAHRILLEKHWVPFLKGRITREEALGRVAGALHQAAGDS